MAQTLKWGDLESLPPGKFEPVPHYDHDSDSLSIFMNNDESYRERIDALLTVYRSLATNKVVGCHIKHVTRILSTFRAFNLGVQSRGVTIGLLLLGLPLSDDQEGQTIAVRTYREIVKPIAETVGATEIDVDEFAPMT